MTIAYLIPTLHTYFTIGWNICPTDKRLLPWRILDRHILQGLSCLSDSKLYLDRFSQTQTMLRATYVGKGRMYALRI